jgi:hypothetical protein
MARTTAEIAASLLDCLRDQFNLLPAEMRPGKYRQVAGTLFIEDIDPTTGLDVCCPGTGWVRLGDKYPSSQEFPEPDEFIKANACMPVAWAQSIDVGVARCYPGYGNESGPSQDDHAAASALDIVDLQTIEKALCCWAKTLVPKGTLYQVTGIAVAGPEGICISRIANIIVQVGVCRC